MKHHLIFTALICVPILGSLAGCTTYEQATTYLFADKETKCPDTVILANAAVLPAFDPAKGDDPSSIVYTAGMSRVKNSCDYRKVDNNSDSRIFIAFHATRPSGGPEAVYRVPYFVAISLGGKIIDKKNYWQDVTFPKGVATVDIQGGVESLFVQAAKRKRPVDYHFVLGFQLTKAQIDYNKKLGRYEP